MTRETRVGLLLGLAIIIAIGMILSEVTEPKVNDQSQPTAFDSGFYKQKDVPLEDVTFRPAVNGNERTVLVARDYDDDDSQESAPARVEMRRVTPLESFRDRPLASGRILRQTEEELSQPQLEQPQDGIILEAPQRFTAREQYPEYEQAAPPAIAARAPQPGPYTVQPEDSLYRIAEKVYGPGKGRFYTKIFEANRDKMSDPSMVVVGQRLVIPPLAESNRPAAAGGETRISLRDQRALDDLRNELHVRSLASERTGDAKRTMYIVRQGDNLTRIAAKTMKDTSEEAIKRLYEANRDKLPDRDTIVVGMKLRIPS